MSEKKHEHHVGCSFGSPDCPEYGESLEREKASKYANDWEKIVGTFWYGACIILIAVIAALVILELIEQYSSWL